MMIMMGMVVGVVDAAARAAAPPAAATTGASRGTVMARQRHTTLSSHAAFQSRPLAFIFSREPLESNQKLI
jgi:hypothetical protein